MLGTIVNVITVLIGSFIGLLLRNRLPDKFTGAVFQVIGLFTLALGFMMALKGEQLIVIVFSLITGVITGTYLKLEDRIESGIEKLKHKYRIREQKFTEGLITSFMLFCMGSMTILGSIDEGLGNGSELLLTKSLMDGFAAMALSSALGIGVTFSVIPLFLYQGTITLLAWWLGSFMPDFMIQNLTATGGIMLLGLGLNLLNLKKIKIINILPGLIWVILFSWCYQIIEGLI